MTAQQMYYLIKPAIPRFAQISLRRALVGIQLRRYEGVWPINSIAGQKPADWPGWPEGKKFGLLLTHDVDTAVGQGNCLQLKNLEKGLGFRSCFNFVPERYPVSSEVLKHLAESGFEIGVHGLNHDGKLYKSRDVFTERATKINHYLREWGAVGFRSPAMHHNLEWIHELNIKYDTSTFDTDPFEPQSDGVGTIFPFFVKSRIESKGYFELPYTLPQDFTLFVLMRNCDIEIWKKKLDWIAECGGMAMINTHPDYMNFGDLPNGDDEYSCERYSEFLGYVKKQYQGDYCNLLPSELVSYLSSHNYAGVFGKG